MKMKYGFFIAFLVLVNSCSSTASSTSKEISGPAYTGSGGKGMSLAILEPKAIGLEENQNYLPILVQGEFVSNFSGYSAISVMDRVNMDKVYAELLSGYYSDDDEAGLDLGHLTATDHILTGNITRTTTGYTLQVQITKTADKITAASYSGTFTFEELDNLSGIRQASLELLEKMGIELTVAAKTSLSGAGKANDISAQTALAKGIKAQKSGTIVEAMAYYYDAVSFSPKLSEANGRLSTLSSTVSSGNIGESVRNDIQRRNEWVKMLTEAEDFFSKHLPFELIYSTSLTQGKIDYTAGTVDLKSSITFRPSDSFKVFDNIMKGLESTGKRKEWGLAFWPALPIDQGNWGRDYLSSSSGGIFTQKANREYFPQTYDMRDSAEKEIVVTIVLINENGTVISKVDMRLSSKIRFALTGKGRIDKGTTGVWLLQRPSWYAVDTTKLEATVEQTEIHFSDVNANDITDNLVINVVSVNGVDVDNVTDYIKIMAN
jgi:hypothetical protein